MPHSPQISKFLIIVDKICSYLSKLIS